MLHGTAKFKKKDCLKKIYCPTGCFEKPSLHCVPLCDFPCALATSALASSSFLESLLGLSLSFLLNHCIGSLACPIMSAVAVDCSFSVNTSNSKEKRGTVEEAENGGEAPANEQSGEQEADKEVNEKEEEGVEGRAGGAR